MRSSSAAVSVGTSSSSKQFYKLLLILALIAFTAQAAVAQNVVVSPTSLAFAAQVIGTTSSFKTITIMNYGESAQPVNIVASSGYAETDNCGGSIAPFGSSCTASITFSPLFVGSNPGAVSVFDSSHNLLTLISLTGTGGGPVTVSPPSLSFTGGTVGVLSGAKTFKLTNATTGTVNISSITASSNYVVNTGTCLSTPLAKAGSCTVSVQVKPTSATDDGAILITDNAPNATPLVVKLTSAATGGPTTPISLSKTSLTFTTPTGTTSASQSVTVTNSSTSTVTPGPISASSNYAIVNNTCGASLIAGGTCTFGITFNPTFVGAIEGSAAVSYTGNNSPQLVNLTGTSEALLTLSPASMTFAGQIVGTTSAAKAVKITNYSTSAATLTSITLSSNFVIQPTGTTCPLTGGMLAGGKNCTVEVQFAPTIGGAVEGSLTVANTSSPNPLLLPLVGTGSPTATFNPTSALQGSNKAIVISGLFTHFGASTTISFGSDITTGTLTVNGPTNASVPITIDDVAALGQRNVTITTGAEVVTVPFTVIAGAPTVSLITPNRIQATQTESVSLAGAFTAWTSGTTKANFGPGVSVGGAAPGTFGPVTVNSATTATASLATSGAATGFRTVQVQTGTQTLTVNNGLIVGSCTTAAPTVVQISPKNTVSNVPLNAQVQIQFSVPMNPGTFSLGNTSGTTVFFYDATTGVRIPGTISFDASGTIATINPSVALPAGRELVVYLSYASYAQDACGNNLPSQDYYFYTASNLQLAGPTLTGTSPVSGDTNIPLNGSASGGTPVVLQFNTQIDPLTAQTYFSVQAGGNPVAGNFSFSSNGRTVTFTPTSALTASTTYTVSYGAQITDDGGNALTNPGSFTFQTGTAADTTAPSVTLVDPAASTLGVGLNATPHVTFSEPVNGLTIPSALNLYYEGGIIVPATVTVSANRLIATVTPSAPLLPDTYYLLYFCGYTNIAGNNGSCFESAFYTGTSAVTTSPTVTTISPTNAQTGVPLNATVVAVLSNNIDPTTVNSTSITVKPGTGNPIAGSVSLASDNVTLSFTPSAPLSPSTVYNVTVSGFNDIDGNPVTTFTSTFTTGAATYGSGSFSMVSSSPTNGATGVSVTSPVTVNMTNLIDPASVSPSTFYVYESAAGDIVAGTYSVSGASVTFTPSTQYPANTQMTMYVYGLKDEAGNAAYVNVGTFTTAATVDHTAPTVTITPANGATNIGLNTPIVLAFSKSINPSTITANTVALFNGDTSVGYGYIVSRDNRTITINYNGSELPSGVTLTVELTSGIQDLSGNSLANTSSQFTLTSVLPSAAPYVVAMRPGNGATNVLASTVVTLFTSGAMNPASVVGALHVSQNGVPVSGTVQLTSNAQTVLFTPAASFNPGDSIQVGLDSSALSADGVALSAFSGQFTVAGSPTNTTATAQLANPIPGATGVPQNTIIQVEYSQPLKASTLNNTSVTLYQYSTGTYLTPKVTLVGTQVINIAPTSNLVAGSQYQVYISPNSAVTDVDGVPVQPYAYNFTAGTAADTAGPTIVSEAPINNATNIGTNTTIAVNFNKTINPVSVTGTTIKVTAGPTTEVPTSISFNSTYTRVSIVPEAPLPPSTQITVTINGVNSEAGKPVAAKTTHFTTAAQPDFTAPYVTGSSVVSGQTNVPVNSAFSMTFSKPMDIGSFPGPTDVGLYNNNTGQYLAATVSWSADQTTIYLVPTSPLLVGDSYQLFSYYMTDLEGNPEQNFAIDFTASFTSNTNPATVVNTSPENTETAVPVNAPVQILFSEPIQPTSISQITLKAGSTAVEFTPTFSDGNQLLTLTPTLPLLASSTTYTISISGVKDTAGNVMTSPVTNTFTTGPTFDLLHASVTVVDPPNGSLGVGTNVTPRILFNKRLNPLSVVSSSNELYNHGSIELYNNSTGQYVPATVSMSADRMMATITPNAPLQAGTSYEVYVGYGTSYYDVAGNVGGSDAYSFITGLVPDTTHATVTTVSPLNAQTSVPLNATVVAVLSNEIDPTTVNSTSITVKPGTGNPIAGSVSLASDNVTLTFTPSAPLTASTLYNVSIGGFNDVEGNSVTTFASTFTTGTSTYASGSFTVVSSSPTNGATGVSVTSPVTVNMTNLIDPASVSPSTFYVYESATSDIVAGTYSVSGASMTFTPSTQYPANTQMTMYVYGLKDEAGNAAYVNVGTFTTTTTVDHTAPTVTITPANGTTNAGPNTQVVLTFSKSINPSTITTSSVNLLNGDVPLNPPVSISRDNHTVILNYTGGTLPPDATITVTANNLVTDLSGNALANTTSRFTTTPAAPNVAPTVISMRPGNGSTGVLGNTVITLFTSAPMNAGTISGALHVVQNGVIVAGTTNMGSNGQSIEFTPSAALTAGVTVQVFLDSTAQDIYGNYLSHFTGQFTVAGSLTSTAATAQVVNPAPSATGVPLNTIIQVGYNQALQASTLNNTSVTLYQYSTGTYLTPTVTLVGAQVINIAPTSSLVAGSQYQVYISPNNGVTNIDGVAVQPYAFNFTAGTAADTVAPTIVAVAPPNLAPNIGTNAGVRVEFSKAINPVSVTGSSIQLSAGSTVEVPASISFSSNYTRAIIVPQAPLPSGTQMKIAISGVTSEAGVAVATQSTTFTTMAGPDFGTPTVINPSVQSNQTVGTNASFAMQFDKPMDPTSVNPGGVTTDVFLYDYNLGSYVSTNISMSTDLTSVFLKPTANLTASHQFEMCSYDMMDLSGNSQQNFCVSFYSAASTVTTGPTVQQVSPPSGATGVPLNAPVQILFNEPISGASTGGVVLMQGSTVVPTVTSLYDGDQGIQLLPVVPLAPSTVYSINVTGVVDITGNAQSSFPAQSFTTGTGTDLTVPTIVSTNPANGATNVPDNTTVQVVFSSAMDPASFDPANSFSLHTSSNLLVPATITFSADYKTVTLHPNANLTSGTTYYMYIGYLAYLYDQGGNRLSGTYITFTAH